MEVRSPLSTTIHSAATLIGCEGQGGQEDRRDETRQEVNLLVLTDEEEEEEVVEEGGEETKGGPNGDEPDEPEEEEVIEAVIDLPAYFQVMRKKVQYGCTLQQMPITTPCPPSRAPLARLSRAYAAAK